jgi:hypothetical protein
MKCVRIVLDTNVLISSLIETRGPSATLINSWRDNTFTLITSQARLAEMRAVLARPRIQKWITPDEASKLLSSLPEQAELVEPGPAVSMSSDEADNVIIATAIAGSADFLVTGDKRHLLNLREVAGIPIITPREALNLLPPDK